MLNVKKLRSGPARFTKALEAFRARKDMLVPLSVQKESCIRLKSFA